ncbi:MAG: class I tRNA ligase family protein [Deltaproteobacteria bacterium]|nr:class I tRNA ligase family protein [Deltaproteobacteria bacterium]
MTLYVTNTLTRKKEPFKSRVEKRVKMFTCGPSIYRRPHVGNFATFLFEDILQRYLEYSGYEIQRVINFTDVEDKALEEAAQKDISLSALTEPVANRFLKEAASLQMRLPREIPRSSTHVDEAVRLIQELLKGGYAYWHQNDVFYDPLKFKGFGKLYGLDMSRWPKKKRHFRKDTYPGQRWNLGDFILWHGYRPHQDDRFYWDTPIGKGRPAWNIQDPAIISSRLGYQIDIACGGVDNLYRHHDYTIAVMEAVSQRLFSRYWLHGEHVLLDGRKMSKSKGNILYLEDIQDKGFTAKDIRFYLIYGHYRKKINLTLKQLQKTADQLTSFRDTVRNVCHSSGPRGRRAQNTGELIHDLTRTFEDRMNDDLDVRGAFDNIASILGKLNALHNGHGLSKHDRTQILHALERIDSVFGVLF